jgi:DNA-binding response OmpR family regulator
MSTDLSGAHILVVDDDPKVRLLLRRCFEPEGYEVSEAAGGTEAMACASSRKVDLVTLDLNLGRENGLTVARQLLDISAVPIIMITGKGDIVDKVVGLELGADDYIAKPFHLREVLARVRSVLRRSATGTPTSHQQDVVQQSKVSASGDILHFDGWSVDLDRLEATHSNGSPCDLTTSEFRLLEVFLKAANRVLSRDQLMDMLNGEDWNANDRAVDNLVARLRKKIEEDPSNPVYVKTVRGAGYKFTARVESAKS